MIEGREITRVRKGKDGKDAVVDHDALAQRVGALVHSEVHGDETVFMIGDREFARVRNGEAGKDAVVDHDALAQKVGALLRSEVQGDEAVLKIGDREVARVRNGKAGENAVVDSDALARKVGELVTSRSDGQDTVFMIEGREITRVRKGKDGKDAVVDHDALAQRVGALVHSEVHGDEAVFMIGDREIARVRNGLPGKDAVVEDRQITEVLRRNLRVDTRGGKSVVSFAGSVIAEIPNKGIESITGNNDGTATIKYNDGSDQKIPLAVGVAAGPGLTVPGSLPNALSGELPPVLADVASAALPSPSVPGVPSAPSVSSSVPLAPPPAEPSPPVSAVLGTSTVPEAAERAVDGAGFLDKINQILKFRVGLKKDAAGNPTGQPDFTKRDELAVAYDVMVKLSEADEGGSLVQILDAITKAKTPTEMRKLEAAVRDGKEDVAECDAASTYVRKIEKNFINKVSELFEEVGAVVLEDVSEDVASKQREIDRLEKRFTVLASNKGDTSSVEQQLSDAQGNLNDLNKKLKGYNKRKSAVDGIKSAFDEFLKHFKLLEGVSGLLSPGQKTLVGDLRTEFKKFKSGEKNELKKVFDDLVKALGSTAAIDLVDLVKKIDAKHAELSKALRADEQALKLAQEGISKNRDLTDHQFSLKVFEHKVRSENPKMEEEEVKKLAKREFLNEMWTLRTKEKLDDVVEGADGDLLTIMDEAMLKDTVLKFKYKVGGNTVAPFEGIDPADLKRETIDNLLKSGRVDLKSAFFLLAVLERNKAARTYQYGAVRKYIFDLLMDEQGLTQAQAIRAFNEKYKKVTEMVDKNKDVTDKRNKFSDEAMKLKVERANARVKSGELDQVMFMRELEDAGVAKDGKLDQKLLSRLGVNANYYLNHRYWTKAGDVAANRALWLGEMALLQPGLLAGRWLGAEALALTGGVAAFGGRMLFSYPLSVLRAPLHIVTHPFSTLFSPIKTLKGAGASVVEGFKAIEEGKKAGQQARRAFVKGQVGKGKSGFSMTAKERIDLTKIREREGAHNSMKNLTSRIDKLEKKVGETVLVLGADVDMNFEKYKKITGTNEQETGQRQAA